MANKVFATLGSGYVVTHKVNEIEVLKTDVNSETTPSPVDGVSMALASCMLASIRATAEKYNIPVNDTKMEIEAIMKDSPRRIGEFKIDVFFNASFSEKENAAIERSIKGCTVANSLSSEIVKTVTYHY